MNIELIKNLILLGIYNKSDSILTDNKIIPKHELLSI